LGAEAVPTRDRRNPKRERNRSREVAEARQHARAAVGAAGIPRILRLAEVEVITGRPRTAIYRLMQEGTFPIPIPLGARAVGWLEDEVKTWIERRIADRDANKSRELESA
jgi:prophage regulatory protein